MKVLNSKSFLLPFLFATGFIVTPQSYPQTTKPTAPGYANVVVDGAATITVGQTITLRSEAECEISYGNPYAMIEITGPENYSASYQIDNQNGISFTPTIAGTYSMTSYVQPGSATCYNLSPHPNYNTFVVTQ